MKSVFSQVHGHPNYRRPCTCYCGIVAGTNRAAVDVTYVYTGVRSVSWGVPASSCFFTTGPNQRPRTGAGKGGGGGGGLGGTCFPPFLFSHRTAGNLLSGGWPT